MTRPEHAFVVLPDPGRAGSLDDLIEGLRSLKVWAGDPSYDTIRERINTAWAAAGRPDRELARKATVADCFKTGRRRLNTDLVLAVVGALHPDLGYVTQWRQALRVVGGEARAAAQVRVQDSLPDDLAGFTGRTGELARLRQVCRDGGAVVISGMAGVGKTQLAVHAGHLLARQWPLDRVLFVNLRGFHPDPAQPPADPAAVLDGFLRLLGVPGQRIPHDLAARAALFRGRLGGSRTLIVLDNAADADQVRPLLPATAGCPVLITSRPGLIGLPHVTHLSMDVFTADEAAAFLTGAVPATPAGADPHAAARIARRCGRLPLALGLLAGHIRRTPGWTLSDHADRLDERHRERRLDADVRLALELSYQHLSADLRRLLRLAALHPGHDVDAYAAAALSDADLPTVRTRLRQLHRDHLMQRSAPGRYTFHDLVRAFATGQGADEDPPPVRRAALTRLFDYYQGAAAAAMDTLYPAEADHRPGTVPPGTPALVLTAPDAALAWLDAERPTLVTVAEHTADHGWPAHAVRLSTTVYRYLDGGHSGDALTLHGHAHRAALHTDDPAGQAHALNGLGTAHLRLGRYGPAADHLRGALRLFRQAGDPAGQARVLGNLGNIDKRLGHYQRATDHHRQALGLFRQAGDPAGEARSLRNLGVVETRLGRHEQATEHLARALTLCRLVGDPIGEADTLAGLGDVEARLGRYRPSAEHREQAMRLYRRLGDHASAAATLDDLGIVYTRLGQPDRAAEHHGRALAVFRDNGDRDGQAWALNGLGEAAHRAGRPDEALAGHRAAHAIAVEIGSRDQQARAHAGLGHGLRDDPARARRHYERALALYAELGMPEADPIRELLATLDGAAVVGLGDLSGGPD